MAQQHESRYHLGRFLSAVALFVASIVQQPAAAGGVDKDGWFHIGGDGEFSTAAESVCGSGESGIVSPDSEKRIVPEITPEGDVSLVVDTIGRKLRIKNSGWHCQEAGWSADSERFFVSYSAGGAVGTFRVSAYRIVEGKLKELNLVSEVRRDFSARYPRCFMPEQPNIGGIAWSTDSKRLLVAAQVLPHSNCENMGTFMAYEVAVPSGKIMRRYSQIKAKKLFPKLLGPMLKDADDDCFLKPGSCRIPQLHEQ